MANDFPGPLSPDQLAQVQSYYGAPGINMSSAPPVDPASYYGPPAAPAMSVAAPAPSPAPPMGPPHAPPPPAASYGPPAAPPPPPAEDPNAIVSPMASVPPPNMSTAPSGPTREPTFTRERPGEEMVGPPVARQGFASSDYAKSMPKGGGKANPDPFGVKGAQGRRLGSYDDQAGAMNRLTAAEQDKNVMVADAHAEQARLKEEDAAIARAEQEEAQRGFDAHMVETNRQLADVRQKKIDPTRLMNDGGMAAIAVVGGLLGGIYQGINKLQSNPFLDDLNHKFDRDIAAQEKDLDTQKFAIGERSNLLGQQRSMFKDSQLAKLQARNLYYAGVEEQIAAEAARYDNPIYQARADEGLSILKRERAGLESEIARAAQAQAGAAAAAQAAARRQAIKDNLDERKMRVEEGELLVKARAADGKGVEKVDEGTKDLSKELSKPELIEAKKTIDDLKKKLVNPQTGEIDGSRGIPGVGRLADIRETVAPPLGQGGALDVAGLAGPAGWAARGGSAWLAGLSDEERVGRQEWNRLFDSYKVAVTGAGAGATEIDSLRKSFQGANTPAEQAAAIRLADAQLAERESRIRGGFSGAVNDKYDQQAGAARASRGATVARKPVK